MKRDMYSVPSAAVIAAAVFFFLLAGFSSCSGVSAQSFDPETAIEDVYSGSRSLAEVCHNSSRGNAYVLARYFEEHIEQVQPMWESAETGPGLADILFYSLEHEPAPFGTEAGISLLKMLSPDTNATLMERAAKELQHRFDRYYLAERAVAEAWYRLEQDRELGRALDRLERFPEAEADAEVLLWRIVHAWRVGSGKLGQYLNRFLVDFPAGDVHWRLERYVAHHQYFMGTVDMQVYALLQQKALASQRQLGVSGSVYLKMPWPEMSQQIFDDVYIVAGVSGTRAATADELQSLAAQSEPLQALFAQRTAGRLLVRAGRMYDAERAFETAARYGKEVAEVQSGDEESQAFWQYQQALVSWLDCAFFRGAENGIRVLHLVAEDLQSYGAVQARLHDTVSSLVRAGQWQEISSIQQALPKSALPGLQARMAWILAEAVAEGVFEGPSREDLLQIASDQQEDVYYYLLASAALGEQDLIPALIGEEAGDPDDLVYSGREYREWAAAVYEAGLLDEGYSVVREAMSVFSPQMVAQYADRHYESGQYIQGMRLLDRAVYVHGGSRFSEETFRNRYPRAFQDEIQLVMDRYKMNAPVFTALVREESYFDPDIRSWVGAHGLTQLMPGTAADMAQLLRLRNPDLSDPQTNLTIGGLYYSRLLARFSVPVYALIAYNAGQGRMRRWISEGWAPSSILLHEGLPYEQTRHYVRKITVSAAHYAWYYNQTPFEELLFYLFPDFKTY